MPASSTGSVVDVQHPSLFWLNAGDQDLISLLPECGDDGLAGETTGMLNDDFCDESSGLDSGAGIHQAHDTISHRLACRLRVLCASMEVLVLAQHLLRN